MSLNLFTKAIAEPAGLLGREQDRKVSKQIKVALFCGGRGSASLIREMMRWPQIHLSLLVNGYDDGLSTGQMRVAVPNMLGPSDFRKNLSRIIDLHSSEQYTLQKLLEYRFSNDISATDIRAFEDFIESPKAANRLPAPLDVLFRELHPEIKRIVVRDIRLLLAFHRQSGQPLSYQDCSLGNLVFAGAYLAANSDFNASVKNLSVLFGTPDQLINVTRGENRILVALKSDGEILTRESEIVDPQSAAPIVDIFLLAAPLTQEEIENLATATLEEKHNFLRKLDSPVSISPEADHVLRQADLIIYGPGTQFSSLLPSYKTKGLSAAIQESSAAVKIFIANLDHDHDIQGLTVSDLVDRALALMEDPEGQKRLITHIFVNETNSTTRGGVAPGSLGNTTYKSASVVFGNFESTASPGTHSGFAVVRRAIDHYEMACKNNPSRSLEIYVDLRDRSRAIEQLLQEFLDLPWTEHFDEVQLHINHLSVENKKLPDYATLASTDYRGLFTEVDALMNWLSNSDSDYLVTLTGDGEYRLQDIFIGVQLLRLSAFGAVYGSRTQSRNQFHSSLNSAYGEHPSLAFISFCGAFCFTAIFGLLFRAIFSDPFTGFRIYRRSKFTDEFTEGLKKLGSAPAATVTRLMLDHKIEIAEIPVVYRTFRGFTKPGWRLKRGLMNLFGLLR